MSTEVEDIKAKIAAIERLLASSDETKRAEAKRLYEEFRKQHGEAYEPEVPDCPDGQHYDTTLGECAPDVIPPGCPPLPDDGRPQPHKNANTDPNTWKVVPMRDDPALFKVTDNADINVADQFQSQNNAEQFVAHYKCQPVPEPCPAGQHRDQSGNCVPDDTTPPPPPPPGGQLGPYASTGKELGATTRRATRHYASGKPDDETIEKNTKDIPYQNYQCIYFVTMHDIEHDDNISSKLGGTHMGTGWHDHGLSFESGQTCLGTEPDHPNTNSCIKKGAQIGSIIEKRVGLCTVWRRQGPVTELWTKLPNANWVKQLENTGALGGFTPDQGPNQEAQLRIDGFTDGSDPTIDVAVVQEIGPAGSSPPPPPPPPPPTECPPGQHKDPNTGQCVPDNQPPPPPPPPTGGIIEEGVKMLHEKIGNTLKFTYGSSNEGRAQWRCEIGKCMINQEVTAIFDIHQGAVTNNGEEISIKLRGGRHSSSAPEEGSCYIIGLGYDGSVNAQYESPHPNNHAYGIHGDSGNIQVGNVDGKKIAIKAIVYQKGNGDHLECWLDIDPVKADGSFNNNYQKFWELDVDEFAGKCNGEWALLRLDDIAGAPENPEVDLIYGSVREIKPPA